MSWKERYEWYKAHGICPKCGRNDAVPGMVHCGECLYKLQQRNVKVTTEKRKEYNARCRERRKSEHRCQNCGKPLPPTESRTCCDKCRLTKNIQARARRVYSTRRIEGKCLWCGGERVPGYFFCEQHLEKQRANMLHARTFIDWEKKKAYHNKICFRTPIKQER